MIWCGKDLKHFEINRSNCVVKNVQQFAYIIETLPRHHFERNEIAAYLYLQTSWSLEKFNEEIKIYTSLTTGQGVKIRD